MRSNDKFANMADIMRSIEPDLQDRLTYCQTHVPSPVTNPATSALLKAYIVRLELQLSAIRAGAAGLKDEFLNRPHISTEMQEFESWIMLREPRPGLRELIPGMEDALGNWFVSKQGYSYTQTKEMLQQLHRAQSKKGAPSKRHETLKMMDARLSNGWSYATLAAKMCDCGAATHTIHCSERIRKRLKELESFLNKYDIRIPPSSPENNRR